MAGLLNLPVHILGIAERPGRRESVERLVRETQQALERLNISHRVTYDQGRGSVIIAKYARGERNIAVVGPLGRPIWRRYLQGRSFRRLLAQIETPILYVPQARIPIKRILLCMGGLGYSFGVACLLILLAQASAAQVTLMHVVEPVTLDYPLAKEVHENWKEILQTDTPQGRNIKKAIEQWKNADILPKFKVCHGSAVSEILNEAREWELRPDWDGINV